MACLKQLTAPKYAYLAKQEDFQVNSLEMLQQLGEVYPVVGRVFLNQCKTHFGEVNDMNIL